MIAIVIARPITSILFQLALPASMKSFALLHSRPPQAIVDWRIAQQGWHCHGREAGQQHWQKKREASRHLGNQNNAGHRSTHNSGEERGHADNGKGCWAFSEVREPATKECSQDKTALSSKDKQGRKQTARRPCRIGHRTEAE